jgi:radical SAM-linked protein
VTRARPDRPADEVAQRLRVRYARRGRMRFTSHRDVQRALERALRQARVPVAFSGGFTRHPRISYVGAAPTGTCSEAEYLELGLREARSPDEVAADLDAAMPAGLDVLEVVEARTPGFAERCAASRWLVELPGVSPAEARAAAQAFLAAETAAVERVTPHGRRTVDARAAVLRCEVAAAPDAPGGTAGSPPATGRCAILDLVVRHSTPAVRPDDVLAGIARRAGSPLAASVRVTRLAQGPLEAPGALADPLAPDRAEAPQHGSPAPGTAVVAAP